MFSGYRKRAHPNRSHFLATGRGPVPTGAVLGLQEGFPANRRPFSTTGEVPDLQERFLSNRKRTWTNRRGF
jgi:hypothetical protein